MDILAEVRAGAFTPAAAAALHRRCSRPLDTSDGILPTKVRLLESPAEVESTLFPYMRYMSSARDALTPPPALRPPQCAAWGPVYFKSWRFYLANALCAWYSQPLDTAHQGGLLGALETIACSLLTQVCC